jgi:hypothetical protein
MIVDGQFLALFYLPMAEVQNVSLDYPGDQIRIAGVVYVLRPTPTYQPVQSPIVVERENVIQGTGGTLLYFAPADPLAGILDDLALRRYRLARVDSPAVNRRGQYRQPEAGKFSVNTGRRFNYGQMRYDPIRGLSTSTNSCTDAALLASAACSSGSNFT